MNSEKVEINQEADPLERGMEASLSAIRVSLYAAVDFPVICLSGTSSLNCDPNLHGFVVVYLFVCMFIF